MDAILMENYEFKDVKALGIAFDRQTNRIWICIDGQSVLRAKIWEGKLLIEYHEPKKIDARPI